MYPENERTASSWRRGSITPQRSEPVTLICFQDRYGGQELLPHRRIQSRRLPINGTAPYRPFK